MRQRPSLCLTSGGSTAQLMWRRRPPWLLCYRTRPVCSFRQHPAAHRKRPSKADSSCKSDTQLSLHSAPPERRASLAIRHAERCGRARRQETRGGTAQQRHCSIFSVFSQNQKHFKWNRIIAAIFTLLKVTLQHDRWRSKMKFIL